MRYDADQARAARDEEQKNDHEYVFGGRTYKIPARPPARLAFKANDGSLGTKEFLEFVFGDDAETYMEEADDLDLRGLMDFISEAWGFDVGESPASGDSSQSTTEPSRLTGSGSTTETSVNSSPLKASVSSGISS